MPVHDLSHENVSLENAEPIPAGPTEEEAQQKFSAEGELPAVVDTAAVAAVAPTASDLGFEDKRGSDVKAETKADHGMVEWQSYKQQCELTGKPEMWNDQYVRGHTEAKGWITQAGREAASTFYLEK